LNLDAYSLWPLFRFAVWVSNQVLLGKSIESPAEPPVHLSCRQRWQKKTQRVAPGQESALTRCGGKCTL